MGMISSVMLAWRLVEKEEAEVREEEKELGYTAHTITNVFF